MAAWKLLLACLIAGLVSFAVRPSIASALQQSSPPWADPLLQRAALYPDDRRRTMTSEDFRRFPGAGILFCRDPEGVARKAAAAWLIGDRKLVMMNAHNFVDRDGSPHRSIEDCFFQIGGRNYEFDAASLRLGVDHAFPLHITDDWALVHLREAVAGNVAPQPVPRSVDLQTGPLLIKVTMVSPAGHANYSGVSSIETCEIREIDPPTQDGIRRARHDCNDGFGGSGSGLFDEAGHLLAMQSASLDMNRRLAFDLGYHYGSALLLEGELRAAISRDVEESPR